MSKIILISYTEIIKENSIIWFYSGLNPVENVETYSFLYNELADFLNELSMFQQNIIIEGYLLSRSNHYYFTKLEQKIQLNKINIKNFENITGTAYYLRTGQKFEFSLENISNDFEVIADFIFENYNNISGKSHKFIYNMLFHKENYEPGKKIDIKNITNDLYILEKDISLLGISNLHYLRNSINTVDIVDIYRKLAYQCYIFEDKIQEAYYFIIKSLSIEPINEFQILQSLKLLDDILYSKSPDWTNSYLKIIERGLLNTEIEISKENLGATISMLISIETENEELINKISEKLEDNEILKYHFYRYLFPDNLKIEDLAKNKVFEDFYSNHTKIRGIGQDNIEHKFNELIKIQNSLTLFTKIILFTDYNPDEIISDMIFSEFIASKIDSVEKVDENKWWFNFNEIENYEKIIEFHNLLFCNKTPLEKIDLIYDFLTKSKNQIVDFDLWISRVLIFCIKNFDDIDDLQIYTIFSLMEKSRYITINAIIRTLLENLISSKPLNDNEIYFLRRYLNQEINDYKKERILELAISLIQLERKPQMQILQNGTIQNNITESNEDIKISNYSFVELNEFLSFPEIVINQIKTNEELLQYIQLYFSFHILNNEWKLEKIETAYQKLKILQTKARGLSNQLEKIEFVKLNHPQVVDDISLELLEVEMLLTEEPSFALNLLGQIRRKLENRCENRDDWMKYYNLLQESYKKLGLNEETGGLMFE